MQTVTLIIDKRKELSTKYKKLLKSSNNECYVVTNLISAMKNIQDLEPDLIIISDSLDLADFCKKIRALTYDTRPIIIALSKSDDIADKLEVLRSGADDYLSEPVNSEEFVMRVKAHLRREYESNLDNKKSLPNRNYSMRALKRMLTSQTAKSALLISIDNFLNYKENYTELASDKLIQTYWAIIKSTIDENDYFGEIKENEFLVITEKENAEAIANYLIYAFETVSAKFYSIDDNRRGYMMLHDDTQAGRRSGFVHTTIGIVANDTSLYQNTQQLFNGLVQIHKLARIPSKSNYLVERPRISGETTFIEINNNIIINEKDYALSLLLKTILDMQGYKVTNLIDEDLHSLKEAPALFILDAGELETLEGLNHCKKLKEKFPTSKVILTSILHDKEMILNSGADLYLPKPYEITDLIRWVETLIKENQ